MVIETSNYTVMCVVKQNVRQEKDSKKKVKVEEGKVRNVWLM